MEVVKLLFVGAIAWNLGVISSTAEVSIPTVLERCTEDNLNPEQVPGRNRWARKCFSSPDWIEDINYADSRRPARYLLARHVSGNVRAPLNESGACEGWSPVMFCVGSCLPYEERVKFDIGYLEIGEAAAGLYPSVMTLSADSTVEQPGQVLQPVRNYSISYRVGREEMFAFTTMSGARLKATEGHPILTAPGIMKKAVDVVVGDSLLLEGNESTDPLIPDPIVKVEVTTEELKVYNLAPESLNPVENVIFANGIATGSANYQYLEDFARYWGRRIMRNSIEVSDVSGGSNE